MKVQTGKLYGVLTGDVVASSSLPVQERERLHKVMAEGGALLNAYFGARMPLALDIFSGDGWQVLLDRPADLLRAGLLYRANLRARIPKIDTRVAMAIGTVDFIPGTRASEGEGEAFRGSGRLLRELEGNVRMRLAADDRHPAWMAWDAAICALDGLVVQTWTARRACMVAGVLQGKTQTAIAAEQERVVAQQTVQRLLVHAGWEWVDSVIASFETALNTTACGCNH